MFLHLAEKGSFHQLSPIISRSFSHNLFYVVASRFLRHSIFFPSFCLRSDLSFDFPISSSDSCRISFSNLPTSFFSFFPFSLFFILILVSFQFAILLSIPSKMHGMTFLSCFRVYSLNVISSCFYLFMHSPAFLSTCVCRTFLPSFRNSVRVYMLFLSDSSPPSRSPVLHLSLPLCLSIPFFSVTSVHLIFLQNPSRHCPRHKATVRYPLEFWLIYAPIKSVYLIDWRFILETTIDRF